MKFSNPSTISQREAGDEFASGDPHRTREALVAVALNEPDFDWAQRVCIHFLSSNEWTVRAVAATCIGHIARIHRRINRDMVMPLLKEMQNDESLEGYASDAIDDIDTFVDL